MSLTRLLKGNHLLNLSDVAHLIAKVSSLSSRLARKVVRFALSISSRYEGLYPLAVRAFACSRSKTIVCDRVKEEWYTVEQ